MIPLTFAVPSVRFLLVASAALIFCLLGVPEVQAQRSKDNDIAVVRPESVGVSSERLKRVSEMVQRFVDAKRISGAVTLIAHKGKVVHFEAKGLRDVDTNKPMERNTLFTMMSSTKPVLGVAVMMMIEDGKIELNAPVSRYLPEFRGMKVATRQEGSSEVTLVNANREVTVRDLLTHTAGMGTGGLGSQRAGTALRFQEGDTLASFTARVATVPLDFQPGTQWRYSGLVGLDVLSRVVEVASGLPFDVFLKSRLFEPLGMTDTSFSVPDSLKDRTASIYASGGNGLAKIPPFILPKGYYSGSAGLFSTAADMFRFTQMLLNKGELNGKRILSPRSVEIFCSNHVADLLPGQLGRPKGMGFGLTVEVVMDSVVAGIYRSNGSYGWDGAYGTYYNIDPKTQTVSVLMIQTPGGQVMHRPFETAVLQSLMDQ